MPIAVATTRFEVSANGRSMGGFHKLDGLKFEQDVVEYAPGRESAAVFLNRYVNVRKPLSVILARPRSSSMEMWSWHEAARMSPVPPSTLVGLQLFESPNKPVARYHLENAWPSKIEIGGLKAGGSSTMETVTLTCRLLRRV